MQTGVCTLDAEWNSTVPQCENWKGSIINTFTLEDRTSICMLLVQTIAVELAAEDTEAFWCWETAENNAGTYNRTHPLQEVALWLRLSFHETTSIIMSSALFQDFEFSINALSLQNQFCSFLLIFNSDIQQNAAIKGRGGRDLWICWLRLFWGFFSLVSPSVFADLWVSVRTILDH